MLLNDTNPGEVSFEYIFKHLWRMSNVQEFCYGGSSHVEFCSCFLVMFMGLHLLALSNIFMCPFSLQGFLGLLKLGGGYSLL